MELCKLKLETFGQKLENNLSRFLHSSYRDLVFIVGKDKEKIESSGLVVGAASDELFALVNWGNYRYHHSTFKTEIGQRKTEIILPHVPPEVFRIFLKLLFLDDVSPKKLLDLKLSITNLFDLYDLCMEFGPFDLQSSIEALKKDFFENRALEFIETDEFLKSPQYVVSYIVHEQSFQVDENVLFEKVCKWGEYQWTLKNSTAEKTEARPSILEMIEKWILGGIRFPLLSAENFLTKVWRNGILTVEEELLYFKHILLPDNQKFATPSMNGDEKEVDRKYLKRGPLPIYNLEIYKIFKVVNDPPFNGTRGPSNNKVYSCDQSNTYQLDEPIIIESVGFLGPVTSDAVIEVSMQIYLRGRKIMKKLADVKKLVFAKKRQIFHVSIEPPAKFDDDSGEYVWYEIFFTLKGAETQRLVYADEEGREIGEFSDSELCSLDVYVESNGVTVRCGPFTQIAELKFRKVL